MRIVLSDLPDEALRVLFPEDGESVIFSEKDRSVHPCIGCLSCVLRTPGFCVIEDSLSEKRELFRSARELVLVSRCLYGGFSVPVKKLLDRLHPVFQLRLEKASEEETRFSLPEGRPVRLTACFYGCGDPRGKAAAENTVCLLAEHWGIPETCVRFFDQAEDMAGEEKL